MRYHVQTRFHVIDRDSLHKIGSVESVKYESSSSNPADEASRWGKDYSIFDATSGGYVVGSYGRLSATLN